MTSRNFFLVASLAALLASIGDFMLLASSDPSVAEGFLVTGCLLGIFFIPFYSVGYFALASLVGKGRPRTKVWILTLGFIAAFLGTAIHGMTSVITSAMRPHGFVDPISLLETFAPYLAPLWILAAIAILIISILFIQIVLSTESGLPKILVMCSPVTLILIITSMGLLSDWGRIFLIPIGPNIAHSLFFAVLAWIASKSKAK